MRRADFVDAESLGDSARSVVSIGGIDRVGKSEIDRWVVEDSLDYYWWRKYIRLLACIVKLTFILIRSSWSQDSPLIGPCVNVSKWSTA